MKKSLISVLVGIALGVVGSRYLFVGSYASPILWGIAGLLVGAGSANRNEALKKRRRVRFCTLVFLHAFGVSSECSDRKPHSVFRYSGVVGAPCGMVSAAVGVFLKKWI